MKKGQATWPFEMEPLIEKAKHTEIKPDFDSL